jgi:hypothetical protein
MPDADLLGIFQHEIAGEQVSSLAHAARRLEKALAALETGEGEREELLGEAGEALWCLAVQREAMGLRNAAQMMRDYRVPRAVQLRMGLFRPKAG